jgi:Ca2+-binding RTX toxin-like protein
MCSGPPRYYNLINRQAGRPSSPSEDQRTGFSICDYLAGGPGLSDRGLLLLATALAGVAYAATIEGTSQHEVLFESSRNDTIYGRGGIDYINADLFVGMGDRDVAYGNAGGDVDDGDGKDTANGGKSGNDVCFGDPRDQFVGCEKVVTNPKK